MSIPRFSWHPQARHLLRTLFKLECLRNAQEAAIAHVMSERPTIAIMPTGSGKSLCYQLPALLLPGCTLVVSPLIALMKDQCDKLQTLGIAAFQLNSALSAEEIDAAEQAIAAGKAKIVFITPERLATEAFLALITTQTVSLLAVDEAHCISQWGHDFRPAFLEIGRVAKRLGNPRLLALTATAPDQVVEDIAEQLGMKHPAVVDSGVFRPNLYYRVEQVVNDEEKLQRVLSLVAEASGYGIVYCATVAAVEAVYQALMEAGESVTRYHGRLSAKARHENQDAFMDGQVRVMVATNAFGLGIDKSDIRFVIHYQMPSGLDAYYQESGRGGRDGGTCDCVLLYQYRDKTVQRFFMAGRYPSFDAVEAIYRALLNPPQGGTAWTMESLCDHLDCPRSKLQVALSLLRREGVVKQDRRGRLKLSRSNIDSTTLEALMAAYQEKREYDKTMLEQMVFYGQTGYCRWRVLLEHFGEQESIESCGHCDNCRAMASQRQIELPVQPKDPSIDADLPNRPRFNVGDRVRVPRYGVGKVMAFDSSTVTVAFRHDQNRCFHADYVKAA
ncbi:RecQ family ATP-dependent DNA helicase [Chitinimonas lacunae]|uniref:ATP-dependent DNA helicase RecQ n=1 Tax=Chitinimonas lacunae TaxID=1963018 RepID=A0ABV8MPN8_9NEIS